MYTIESLLSHETYKKDILSYLYLLKTEFEEIRDLISELKKIVPYAVDIRESSTNQKSLNIALVISYARNFKLSRGYIRTKEINEILIHAFSKGEMKLHKKILELRDQEFAHSDSKPNDIQIYNDDIFEFSRKVVRESLTTEELDILAAMIYKIKDKIEVFIIETKKQ